MELWAAILLLILAVAGIVVSAVCLREKKTLRLICILVCAAAALLFAGYIGLTALFLDAARNQPPAP